ncbi:MAG: IPT/TIG domain-containing protein, partial [Candidatus Rokubacteria bacterium]|nr:IPT/TIG domain-containing protein [Candidatus Rokubacteria bacterium]
MARASRRSDVTTLSLTVDGQALGATLAPAPPAPAITATASWATTGLGDGVHTLGASATDRAGNGQSANRTVIVDNTPPETAITGGPEGELGVTTATFTFAGFDSLTPAESLVFAWRLDGGTWSAFSAATSATLTSLSETTHVVEVVARDLAGNEDATPATRTFTVRLGPSITAVEPTSGPVGTFVTLTGAGFEPGATTVGFNGTPAIVRTVTATAITTTVPVGASTGPLIVATTRGTVSREFTVTRTRDFAFTAAPASVAVVAGTSASVALTVTGQLADLLTLETGALPAGVTASFAPPVATAVAGSVLTLTADAATPTGGHPIEIRATVRIDGSAVTRAASVTLDVRPPGQTVLVGQVRDRSDRPLGGVRILRGGPTLTTLGTSDAGGNLFIPLELSGAQVLLVDGSPLNTDTAFWPTVPLTVTITLGVVNTLGFVPRLEPMPAAKLIPIAPGQATVLTDAALPGFSMTIP